MRQVSIKSFACYVHAPIIGGGISNPISLHQQMQGLTATVCRISTFWSIT